MTDLDRDHLIGNLVDHLGHAAKRIQMRQTALFFKADPDYGRWIAAGLGLDIAAVERLAGMSVAARADATAPGTFS
jgi:catalase